MGSSTNRCSGMEPMLVHWSREAGKNAPRNETKSISFIIISSNAPWNMLWKPRCQSFVPALGTRSMLWQLKIVLFHEHPNNLVPRSPSETTSILDLFIREIPRNSGISQINQGTIKRKILVPATGKSMYLTLNTVIYFINYCLENNIAQLITKKMWNCYESIYVTNSLCYKSR